VNQLIDDLIVDEAALAGLEEEILEVSKDLGITRDEGRDSQFDSFVYNGFVRRQVLIDLEEQRRTLDCYSSTLDVLVCNKVCHSVLEKGT